MDKEKIFDYFLKCPKCKFSLVLTWAEHTVLRTLHDKAIGTTWNQPLQFGCPRCYHSMMTVSIEKEEQE